MSQTDHALGEPDCGDYSRFLAHSIHALVLECSHFILGPS